MNNILLDGIEELSWLFQRKMVPYWLYGSFPVSLHAGKWIKDHGDVDIAFNNEEEYKKAIQVVLEAGYTVGEEMRWEGRKHKGPVMNVPVRSAEGALFDFSCIKNEVDIDYLNAPEVRSFGSTLRIFTLKDLKKIYEECGEKENTQEMIEIITGLLKK